MADASRFPQLAFPFAIVGASAGWLSARLLANPLINMMRGGKPELAAICATVFAAATGALLTRLCVGRRYLYEIEAPDPESRPSTDAWPLHVGVVLAAGAATGATFITLCDGYGGPPLGALGGLLCALAFVPVCLTVIRFARRAQRARLGSLVAGSDRRAVWGILALTLALATVEAILDWPAAERTGAPTPALYLVMAAGLVTLAILAFDLVALRRARRALTPGLEQRSPGELDPGEAAVPRLDLGLGEELLARFTRSAAAYRGRDRTTALVKGSPEQTLLALHRAALRGAIGLAAIIAVFAAHQAADSGSARAFYQELECNNRHFMSCGKAGNYFRQADPARALVLYQRSCDAYQAPSCAALGAMYERGAGAAADEALALASYGRACDMRDASSCRKVADLLASKTVAGTTYRRIDEHLIRGCSLGDQPSCERLGPAVER